MSCWSARTGIASSAALVARWQHVRPAARGVIAEAPCAGAGLDVGAEQLEATGGHARQLTGARLLRRAPVRPAAW